MDILAMGGYGFYVWGAYGVTALCVVLEIVSRARTTRAPPRSLPPARAMEKA